MPQYLNPYEGVGNALMTIGQNYDLDRRRKREAEEDQKRRRSDFKWQMGLEEAAKEREYERTAPERELKQKIEMARLAKAEADAVSARIGMHTPKVINYPGAGGSEVFSPQFDAEGNVTGVQRTVKPFTPYPREPSKPNYVEGYDENGNRTLFNPETRETINTGMRGTAPPILDQPLSQKERNRILGDREKALRAIDVATPEQLGIDSFDESAVSAARNKQREAVMREYSTRLGEPIPEAPRSPTALGAVGAIAKGAMGLMGNVANAVTPMTEQDVADAYARGEIDQQGFADRMAKITGGPVKVNLPTPSTGESKTATSDNTKKKPTDITKTPEFKAQKAQLKKQYKDATDAEIEEYLLETWGK